jgi:MFS family permease
MLTRGRTVIKRFFDGIYYEFRRLNRIDTNILVFIKYGLLYDLMLNLYKPFSAKFLTRLGGNEFHISLLNSLPGLVAIFVLLPGAVWVSRRSDKKKITAALFGVSRLFLLIISFAPFLPAHVRPLALVLLIGLMNLPDSVSQTSMQSFLGDVFDGRSRGFAISMRSKFGTVIVLLVTLVSGLILGFIPKNDSQAIIFYQIFFLLAFIVGIWEIKTFLKFKENDRRARNIPLPDMLTPNNENDQSVLTKIKTVFKDKKFMKFMACMMLFYVTWHAGWPLGAIIQIIELGANEVWLAVFAAANGIVAFLSAGVWNKVIREKGNNFALVLTSLFVCLNAVVVAAAPNNLIMLATFLIGGVAGMGTMVCLLNGLLESTPDQDRLYYFGVFNTFVNISLAISPFIAHFLVTIAGARLAFMMVGGGRLAATLFMLVVLVIIPRRKLKTLYGSGPQ